MSIPCGPPLHDYQLRSRGAVPDPVDMDPPAFAAALSEEDKDLLLRATLNPRGGICSARPPPKKVRATSGVGIALQRDYDDVFGSSDLTQLEDSDAPARPMASTSSGKRRR